MVDIVDSEENMNENLRWHRVNEKCEKPIEGDQTDVNSVGLQVLQEFWELFGGELLQDSLVGLRHHEI